MAPIRRSARSSACESGRWSRSSSTPSSLAGSGPGRSSWRARGPRWCCCTATPTAPIPGGCCWTGCASRAEPRSLSTCRDSGGPRAWTRSSPCWSSSTHSPTPASSGGRRRTAARSCWPATRWAGRRRCERPNGTRTACVAGIVPIAPAGLEMPTWFAAIQGAPLVKAMLSSPVPVPRATLQRAVGQHLSRARVRQPSPGRRGRGRRLRQPRAHAARTWSG